MSAYTLNEGYVCEITLTNGKKYYTGVGSMNSINARKGGLVTKTLKYKGCCIPENLTSRAKDKQYFPIEVDGVDIYSFIDNVADDSTEIK